MVAFLQYKGSTGLFTPAALGLEGSFIVRRQHVSDILNWEAERDAIGVFPASRDLADNGVEANRARMRNGFHPCGCRS